MLLALRSPCARRSHPSGGHKGVAIAVTLTERLDYFGQTVNIAARVQHSADTDEIYISESIYEAEGVKPQREALSIDSTMGEVEGHPTGHARPSHHGGEAAGPGGASPA